MQAELGDSLTILGINEAGYESGNDSMTEGRTLPLLQDDETQDVWDLWHVEYRDVVVLDAEGYPELIYNLTENNLAETDLYQELLETLQGLVEP